MAGGRAVRMREEFKSFDTDGESSKTRPVAAPAIGGGSIPGFLPSDLIVPSNSPIGTQLSPHSPLEVADHGLSGIKLLRLMGWREGQGVGPRTERKKRRKPDRHSQSDDSHRTDSIPLTASGAPKKVYGLAIPLNELRAQKEADDNEESDDILENDLIHTVAPTDTEVGLTSIS